MAVGFSGEERCLDARFQYYKKRARSLDEKADGGDAFFQNQRGGYLRGLRDEPQEFYYHFKDKYDLVNWIFETDFIDVVRLSEYSIGWDLSRISRLTRAILQLALFECQWVEDVPVGVAVNEAVTLAKKYDGDDAGTFVNGILRSFLRGQEQAGTEAPSQEEAPQEAPAP